MTNSGYPPALYLAFAKLEEKNFWFHHRRELFAWALKKYFPKARRFLDVGCGMGFVLQGIGKALPELELHGSDIYESNLKFASERIPKATFTQMDATELSIENDYDVIGAFDVLEHIQDDEAVLSKIFKSLSPNAGLLLSVPQHRSLWSYFDEHSKHVRRYEKMELVEKVERAGFRVLRTTSFVSLLLPLLSTFRKRKTASTPDDLAILSEFKINPLINVLLAGICVMERAAIRAGVSFGAGGSLLLVAVKPN